MLRYFKVFILKILVTGGSGLVGKELKKHFPDALFPTSNDLNLLNQENVRSFLREVNPNYIIHLAAQVGNLHDNEEKKCDYLDNNILMNTILTKEAADYAIPNFLGILSTAVYSDKINDFPIKEEFLHESMPHTSLRSYAYSKRCHALQLDNYREVMGFNYNYLIPCNLYGLVQSHRIGKTHFLNDLISKIITSEKKGTSLELFGDGKPLRQFMFSKDFARIIEKYVTTGLNVNFNVAPEENISIFDYVQIALKTLGLEKIKIEFHNPEKNGQSRKDVCVKRFKIYFKDFKFTSLEDGIMNVYKFYKDQI